jgi:hypothetical protein
MLLFAASALLACFVALVFPFVRMRLFKRVAVAGAAVSAVAAIIGAAWPVQAATSPGWRQIISRHYGPATSYSQFFAVAALSKTNAWAFGGNMAGQGNPVKGVPVALHWNGTSWAGTALPAGMTDAIAEVSAPAANDIWAVTRTGGWILHWNGAKWLIAKHVSAAGPLVGAFSGVTAFSPTNVWVFGGGGGPLSGLGTWHYDGHAWTELTAGQAAGLEVASAISAKDMWAVGGTKSAQSAIERYSGKSWYLASTKGIPAGQWQYTGVRALSDKDVWVTASRLANDSNVPYLLHYNGTAWTASPLPWPVPSGGSGSLGNPVSDGHGGMWFTGETNTAPSASTVTVALYVIHRTAAGQWLRTKVGGGTTGNASGVNLMNLALIPGTASVWGAGAQYGNRQAVIWAYGQVGAL